MIANAISMPVVHFAYRKPNGPQFTVTHDESHLHIQISNEFHIWDSYESHFIVKSECNKFNCK